MEQNNNVDYAKLAAAQNEHNRKIKIKEINRVLSEENKKKRTAAFISAICISATLTAIAFDGPTNAEEYKNIIEAEIRALTSFSGLKEYLANFSPITYISALMSAVSLSKYKCHKKKYEQANTQFYDMVENSPEDYFTTVENNMRAR